MTKEEFEDKIESIKHKLLSTDKFCPGYNKYICHTLQYYISIEVRDEFVKLFESNHFNGHIGHSGWFGSPLLEENQLKRVEILEEFKDLYIKLHY